MSRVWTVSTSAEINSTPIIFLAIGGLLEGGWRVYSLPPERMIQSSVNFKNALKFQHQVKSTHLVAVALPDITTKVHLYTSLSAISHFSVYLPNYPYNMFTYTYVRTYGAVVQSIQIRTYQNYFCTYPELAFRWYIVDNQDERRPLVPIEVDRIFSQYIAIPDDHQIRNAFYQLEIASPTLSNRDCFLPS